MEDAVTVIDPTEQLVEDALTDGLRKLFQNRVYLPLYPFKTICHSLLHHEVLPAGSSSSKPIDYFGLPTRSLDFTIRVAKYGGTDFYGSRHLAKLVSSRSLQALAHLSNHVFEALGKPANTIKTDHINAVFVELFPVSNALSNKLCFPRTHRLEMVIEVFITAKTFDECLNVFIRKVLEDAYKAQTSEVILSAHINIHNASTASAQSIDITTMKSKRQQVLAILKAAIVNEHEISLDFYLARVHTLPVLHAAFATYRQPSTGFIQVNRRYKLTYTDNNENIRCFTKYPLESLTVGIFHTSHDADSCIAAYSKHLQRIELAVKKEKKNTTATASDVILTNYITHLCQMLSSSWKDGEYISAGAQAMLLATIFESDSSTNSHLLEQVGRLLMGEAGHLALVRQAVANLSQVLSLYRNQLTANPAVGKFMANLTLSNEDQLEVDKYAMLFGSIGQAVLEVRQLVQELIGLSATNTEVYYLRQLLTSLVDRYFDPLVPSRSRLDAVMGSPRQVWFTSSALLEDYQAITENLLGYLVVIETNIAVEVLYHLLSKDIASYAIAITNTKGSGASRSQPKNAAASHSHHSQEKLFHQYRNANEELPKNLLDLLGFVSLRVNPLASKFPDKMLWKVMDLSKLLYAEVAYPYEAVSKEGDRQRLRLFKEDDLHIYSDFVDIVAYLNHTNLLRDQAVDYAKYLQIEYNDMPKVVLLETMKMRYLRDVGLLSVLQQATFDHHRVLLPHAIKNRCKWSVDIHAPARQSMLNACCMKNKHGNGFYRLPVHSLPSNICNLLTGGVIGLERILTALGEHERVYSRVWSLPPLFPQNPRSAVGAKTRLLAGLSASTALTMALQEKSDDNGMGKLAISPVIQQEVVYFVDFDHPGMLPAIKGRFADDLVSTVQHLLVDKRWYLETVSCPSATPDEVRAAHLKVCNGHGQCAVEFITSVQPHTTIFTAEALRRSALADTSEEVRALRKALIRAGQVRLTALAVVPDDGTALTLEELGQLFSNKQQAKATKIHAQSGDQEDDGDLFAFSPRMMTDRTSKGAGLQSARGVGISLHESASAATLSTTPSVVDSSSESDEEEQALGDLSSSFDPSYTDCDRMCASSAISMLIAANMSKKPLQAYKLVPMEVTVTLIARHRLYTAQTEAEDISPAVGRIDPSIAIGSPADISRLVSATVYFSSESAQHIPALLVSPYEGHGQAQSLYYQTVRAWVLHRHSKHMDAVRHLMLYAVLSQNYRLLPALGEICCNVAFQLSSLSSLLHGISNIIDAAQMAQHRDPLPLALTLTRYMDLAVKYAITSSSIAHQRGSVAETIKILNRLMHLLHLTSLPLSAAREDSIGRLLVYNPSAEALRNKRMLFRPEAHTGLGISTLFHHFDEDALKGEEERTESGGMKPISHAIAANTMDMPDDHLEAAMRPSASIIPLPVGVISQQNTVATALTAFKDQLHLPEVLAEAHTLLVRCHKHLHCLAFASLQDACTFYLPVLSGDVQMHSTKDVIQMVLTRQSSVASVVTLVERAQSAMNHLLHTVDTVHSAQGMVVVLGAKKKVVRLPRATAAAFHPTEEVKESLTQQLLHHASLHDILPAAEMAALVARRKKKKMRDLLRGKGKEVEKMQKAVRFLALAKGAKKKVTIAELASIDETAIEDMPDSGRDDRHVSFDDYEEDEHSAKSNLHMLADWTTDLLRDQQPKAFLSSFHDDQPADQQPISQGPAESSDTAGGFSVQGFKLLGRSVESAAAQHSMLSVLRAYGAMQQPAVQMVEPAAVVNPMYHEDDQMAAQGPRMLGNFRRLQQHKVDEEASHAMGMGGAIPALSSWRR